MLETAKYDLGFSELIEIWTKLLKVWEQPPVKRDK